MRFNAGQRTCRGTDAENFLSGSQRNDRFRGDCKISVCLCGIAKKLWYKELEKRSRHKTAPLDDTIPSTENIENKSLDNLEKVEVFRLIVIVLLE